MACGCRSVSVFFMLLLAAIMFFAAFSIGAEYINDSQLNTNRSDSIGYFCTKVVKYRPFGATGTNAYIYCGWPSFHTDFRGTVSFIAGFICFLSMGLVCYRKTGLGILAMVLILAASVGMFVAMGFDSAAVQSASTWCDSSLYLYKLSCNFTPFVATCILDAISGICGIASGVLMYFWSFRWCAEEDGSHEFVNLDDSYNAKSLIDSKSAHLYPNLEEKSLSLKNTSDVESSRSSAYDVAARRGLIYENASAYPR